MPYALTAATRTNLGRQSKKTFTAGSIPCVVYGHGIEPKALKVVRSEFRKVYRAAGTSSLLDLAIDGGPSVKVLIQDVQVNPISMEPAHIDFHQIRMDEEVTVDVPLHFIGESKAVKELAGTLVYPQSEVRVKCLPADLPHEITVDLTVLAALDDSITVGSLTAPKGVEFDEDPAVTLVSVTRPMTEEELKKLEEPTTVDVTAIKTEAEEKKAAEDAKKAEETAATEAAK